MQCWPTPARLGPDMGATAPRPAVFLDRDGVLIRATVRDGKPHPPAAARDVEVLPGAAAACRALRAAGVPLIVVTNQPDVARGTTTAAAVGAINDAMRRSVDVDDVVMCLHDD